MKAISFGRVLGGALLSLVPLLGSRSAAGQYIYIANTAEATVSKIDVTTNTVAANYRTWIGPPLNTAAGLARPSRIAMDASGDVFVLNRFFNSGQPVLMKILTTPGTNTSIGPAFPINDIAPFNEITDPPTTAEIVDDRIAWAKKVGTPTDSGKLGRALCIDPAGYIWVGVFNSNKYYKLDASGAPTGISVSTGSHTPYGCRVARNGMLWSSSVNNTVAQIDTTQNMLVLVHTHAGMKNYAISLRNGCGDVNTKVYLSDVSGTKNPYIELDPGSGIFSTPPPPTPALPATALSSHGVAVDANGDVLSAMNDGTVIKYSPAGTVIWRTDTVGSTIASADCHGLIVDANGDAWAVHNPEGRVVKYRGSDGHWMATVPVGVTPNPEPYTYANTAPGNCPCATALKKEVSCKPGGTFQVTAQVTNTSGHAVQYVLVAPPPGATYTVSPNILPINLANNASTPITVTVSGAQSGQPICLVYTLQDAEGRTCCSTRLCFSLPKCECFEVLAPKLACDPGPAAFTYSFTLQNLSGGTIQQVFAIPTAGSIVPQLVATNVAAGGSTPVTLHWSGVTSGQSACIVLQAFGQGLTECCKTKVCVKFPLVKPCDVDFPTASGGP